MYDSGDLETLYHSKLVLCQDEQNRKVFIFTKESKYVFTIPIQSETVMGSEAELEKNGQSSRNPSDYHQDWPMELK